MGKTWGHPFLTPTSLEAPTPTDFGLMARLLVRQTFLFTLVFVSFPLFFLYFWGGGEGARSAISHSHIIIVRMWTWIGRADTDEDTLINDVVVA